MLNLKKQFDVVLNNSGHKVLYRRYNIGEFSEDYKKGTREGVDGARWTYTDTVHLCRISPISVRGTLGGFENKLVYYLKSEVKPRVSDAIIEVRGATGPETADQLILKSETRIPYKIVDIDIKNGLDGLVVYYAIYVAPWYKDF